MERLESNKVKDFVLGGNALITIESGITGKHFTYKIQQSKTDTNRFHCLTHEGS